MATNLVYLHTLVLMVLEADNHGPATMRGQLGPSRAEWLGRAIGMAYFMKLHAQRQNVEGRWGDGDPDSDEKLARRAWWILMILDRWHACSTSSPLLIPEANCSLLPEDQLVLGESGYHLAR
jgi:hypothetical protein